ncbi:hypothetical protein JAAARDRAFT_204482 [Jaapia argillacea MUCL 33604]|uniref:Zn(2)-C6 fungal-type domain-containing protein n=1 Tax=Jaapia argillacea MUCL 33604 TaxID=933084 RepID=A0A067Q107_9AGAM|nr:hypothetical protein JAAARDRAFT_204482 [Jaapia argillacea MUCL 33604]
MSPRSDASSSSRRASSTSPPYPMPPPRRSSNKPKSSRQQFSACGACRMRRVRCDLKDRQQSSTLDIPFAACSNCKERGLKCVDEFAQVKAVKLLRRGRRLQQVEAVYGKVSEQENPSLCLDHSAGPSNLYAQPQPLYTIPTLKPEFFGSSFFQQFLIQRPIIEPAEFTTRFFEYTKGHSDALGIAGQLIAMLLVVWAASFGIDEAGNPIEPSPLDSSRSTTRGTSRSSSGTDSLHNTGDFDDARYASIRKRKERTNDMLMELLRLIDVCGILRKPTWDGVRVLLLILPLTQEVQTHLERLTMYETTLNQIYTLCSLSPASSVSSGHGEYIDALVRSRIFWYAHVHEGVTTGLRGGRLILSDDDLAAFQTTLPPLPIPSSPPSVSPSCNGSMSSPPPLTRTSLTYAVTYRYASIPIRLSAACRAVHTALTGPKARQRGEIDDAALRGVWNELDVSWKELEAMKGSGGGALGVFGTEEVLRFVSGWQIFIFECHSIIREALKARVVSFSESSTPTNMDPPFFSSPPTQQCEKALGLYSIATQKCHRVVQDVLVILRNNLGTSFFELDASLVRDGCFFAAFLVAGELGNEEDVDVCLRALQEMRWAYCKSEEREKSVKMIWEARRQRIGGSIQQPRASNVSPYGSPTYADHQTGRRSFPSSANVSPNESIRQLPRGLSLSIAPTRNTISLDAAPNSACTDDGRWPGSNGLLHVSPHSHHSGSSSPSTGGSPPPPTLRSAAFLPSDDAQLIAAGQGSSSGLEELSTTSAYYSGSGEATGHGQQIFYAAPEVNHYSYVSSESLSMISGHSDLAPLPSRQSAIQPSEVELLAASSMGTSSVRGSIPSPINTSTYQHRYFDSSHSSPAYSSTGSLYWS